MSQLTNAPKNRFYILLVFGAIAVLYFAFPSHNNSGDAWSYAADVRFGHDLFLPHHLLYSATLYALAHIFNTAATLPLGMACNAFFGLLACMVLYAILLLMNIGPKRALLFTAAVAFSFGFWRFATENETYIIPVFFSLLGSWFWVKSWKEGHYSVSQILLSGIFATIACLYHQIHIFWFIGLATGWFYLAKTGRWQRGLLFSSTFLLAVAAYFLVIILYLRQPLDVYHILHFVFHDYYNGSAGNVFGWQNITLGGANVIRTFLQVHGQMVVMVSHNKIWLAPGIIAALLLFWGLIVIFKARIWKKHRPQNIIIRVHGAIFLLQLAFAVYNIGNAEFMAMLPALLAIILAGVSSIPSRAITLAAIAMLVWNFAYGIYPNNRMHFNADDKVTQFIIDHPKDKFVAQEPAIILNQYYYQKGAWPVNVWASPDYYQLHHPVSELKTRVDSALAHGGEVYTDCNGRPAVYNRSSMITYQSGMFFILNYDTDSVAGYPTDAGNHIIFKLKH